MSKDFYREPKESTDGEQVIDPATSKLINDQPSKLVELIHTQRASLVSALNTGETKLQDINKQYQAKEQELNRDVAKIVTDPREKLLPGVTYTLIGIMTGSILTRRRSLPSKILVPLIFGLACFDYSLPETMNNLRHRAYLWEHETFPVWTKKQDEMLMEWNEGLQDVKDFKGKFSKWWNGN
ncbi:MICOS subunit Mic26p [Monosporozyma unispora]|nr:hypothetical protein C6P44_005213 [Kazachstania unispora]